MKKYLALILALALCLSMAACGSSNSSTAASAASSAPAASSAEQASAASSAEAASAAEPASAAESVSAADSASAAEPAGDVTTVAAGKLTVATSPDFPPYEFLDDNGKPTGIEMELAQKIADKLGLELEIDEMDFDSALLAVQQGKADMVMAGVTVTDDRKLVMDFTDSYTTAKQVIVVPEGSDVTLDNLGEKNIGTQRGTTGYIYCVDDYGEDHVTGYDTYTLVIQALLNGQVDCVVMDDAVAQEYVDANPGLSILETEYAVEDYAFGCTKGNTALVDAVNQILKELTDDGTIDSLIKSYLES